ncbi:hypothetical protein JXA47_09225 [Candidatus Sumerlaeota bacterium]|nr:hypothetical protein [Candidatus Sumerlaeota bacterium]
MRNRCWIPLIAALLAPAGCRLFDEPHPMIVERVNFEAVEGALPGWETGGLAPAQVRDGRLLLWPGARAVHSMTDEDHPVALHLDVDPQGDQTGFFVVTRASRDSAGPYGLPRHGVMFAVWDESRLDAYPFNAGVIWLDEDRMIPLARARLRALGSSTLDIYDDSRWVSFAIDGEIVSATLTPDYQPGESPFAPTQRLRDAAQTSLATLMPSPSARGGDVLLGAPIVLAAPDTLAVVSSLTLLRAAPVKTPEEQGRWESFVRRADLRIPRAIQGHLFDAETGDPVMGAFLMIGDGRRRFFTDVEGMFMDTQVPPETGEEGWTIMAMHPDYPATPIHIVASQGLNGIVRELPREGDGELALTLDNDPRNPRVPVTAALEPVNGNPHGLRHHPTPPLAGAMIFRHMPSGDYRVVVRFADPTEPLFTSEPFHVTGQRGQVHSVDLR